MPMEIPLTFDSRKHENFWKGFIKFLEILFLIGLILLFFYSLQNKNWAGVGVLLWLIPYYFHFINPKNKIFKIIGKGFWR